MRHPRVLTKLTASDRGMLQPVQAEGRYTMYIQKENFRLAMTMFPEEAMAFSKAYCEHLKASMHEGNSKVFSKDEAEIKEADKRWFKSMAEMYKSAEALNNRLVSETGLSILAGGPVVFVSQKFEVVNEIKALFEA